LDPVGIKEVAVDKSENTNNKKGKINYNSKDNRDKTKQKESFNRENSFYNKNKKPLVFNKYDQRNYDKSKICYS
jgi:hypothetical protein